MAERYLSQPFVITGEWFLPESSDRRIGGTLSYKPERTELQLLDRLQPLRGTMALTLGDPIVKYKVVHGVTEKGEAVSLFDVWQDGFQINSSSGGVRTPEQVVSFLAIIGGHVQPEGDYADIQFHIPSLEAWLSGRSIRGRSENGSFTWTTQEQTTEPTPIPDGELSWRSGSLASISPHAVSVRTQAYVDLHPREPHQLSWYFEQLPKITSLLTLPAGHQMPADQVTLPTSVVGHRMSVLPARFGDLNCPYTDEHEFFIPRSALGAGFAQLVDKWCSLYDEVKFACSLAVSVLNSHQLWSHVEFLSLMQSLEGLHRALFEGTYMKSSDYDEGVKDVLTAAIPDSVTHDHRNALLSKIRYGNELSLATRIRRMLDILPLSVRRGVLGNTGKLPRSWIDTRNYYTHWDEALKANVLEPGEMHEASVRLKGLLRVLYLHLAGVTEEVLLKALANHSHVSRHLRQLNALEERKQKALNSG
jgi:hypothetical protein